MMCMVFVDQIARFRTMFIITTKHKLIVLSEAKIINDPSSIIEKLCELKK